MGTGNGNRGRTGARRFPVAGTADTPPQGEGLDSLANWIQNSGYDLDRAIVDAAEDIAVDSGFVESRDDYRFLPTSDIRNFQREALISKEGLANDIANPRNNAQWRGIDDTTANLARAAMLPVARRERFYWQTAYTHDQVKPQASFARQAVSRLRDIERTSTDDRVKREAGRIANRVSLAYGLEGNPGVVGIKPGATGRGPFSLVTTPRLQKFDPDRIES